jgi:hypothetical protein
VVSGKFGKAVSISPDNSNIFIGAPGYRDVDYYNGRVYRYINQGLVFGEIISTNVNPVTTLSDSIRINDIEVSLSNSATLTTKLIKDINSKNITGVTSRTDGVSGVEFTEQNGIGYFASNVSAVIADPDTGKGWPATIGSITLNPNGSINTVTIANSGSGYTVSPTITFFGGNLSTAIGRTVLDSAPLKIYTTSAARLKSINILPAIGTGLADIGLQVYYPAQIFQHPNLGVPEKYGTVVTVDQDTGETLLIGSEGAATLKTSTFDKNNTVFDKDTTKFVDVLKNSGAVYVYDYLPIPGETLASPSKYLFNQDLQNSKILFGDNFGSSIAITGNKILVGASTSSYYVDNSGLVHIFKNTTGKKGWTKLRQRTPRVDIDYINQAIVYDKKLQIVDAQLDYLDPAKGKILGIADQDLDYKTVYDPAVYNKGSNEAITIDTLSPWTEIQVGQTWWNLDACRLIDYEQGDLNYRVAHWGEYFPESTIEVLEWIESLVLPSEYSGTANGEAKYADNSAYVESAFLDTQSGLIKTKYYYWVKNKTTVDTVATHRTNSIKTLEKLISDPTGQSIPYMAVIASNAISIFNVNSLLGANNKILKIKLCRK